MVHKAAWCSLVIVAVILISTAAKPFRDEDKDIAYYTEDALLADSQRKPPKIRMNRHGKRGIIEEQDYNGDAEYALYDMKDSRLADGPPRQRLRMNRHGK